MPRPVERPRAEELPEQAAGHARGVRRGRELERRAERPHSRVLPGAGVSTRISVPRSRAGMAPGPWHGRGSSAMTIHGSHRGASRARVEGGRLVEAVPFEIARVAGRVPVRDPHAPLVMAP
ncbi:hypothetical protein GCM10023199_09690 [Actinomycetospora chibensis]